MNAMPSLRNWATALLIAAVCSETLARGARTWERIYLTTLANASRAPIAHGLVAAEFADDLRRARMSKAVYVLTSGPDRIHSACEEADRLIGIGVPDTALAVLEGSAAATAGDRWSECDVPSRAIHVPVVHVRPLSVTDAFDIAILNRDLGVVYSLTQRQQLDSTVRRYIVQLMTKKPGPERLVRP